MEQGAGLGSGFPDAEYTAVGAEILPDAKSVYDAADMIIKVKEPLAPEYELLKEGQTCLLTCTWPRIPRRPRLFCGKK